MADRIVGWRLDGQDRASLLERFPPRYAQTVADHVTHGRPDQAPPLPDVSTATVVGRADDGVGVDALVVAIRGSTTRWDGSRYHITWSLAAGRNARESNDVIAGRGWDPVEGGPEVGLIPADWP